MSSDITFDISNIGEKKILLIAFIFGVVFLCIGFYKAGFNNGYMYVKDFKDQYIDIHCTCKDDFIQTESIGDFIVKKKRSNNSI